MSAKDWEERSTYTLEQFAMEYHYKSSLARRRSIEDYLEVCSILWNIWPSRLLSGKGEMCQACLLVVYEVLCMKEAAAAVAA